MSSESAPPTNPIADLPSGEPIPQSSPVPSSSTPSSSPKKKPSIPLRTLLSLTPKNLDAFLAHLNRCLSTPSGIDTVLLFVCYTSRLSSSLLAALATRALHRSASDWIALVSASRTTVVAITDSSKLPSTAAAAASLLLADRLKNLSSLLSEARTILRLWGLLGMYFWAKRLLTQTFSAQSKTEKADGAPQPTTLDTVISYSQLATCIVFQALENGAYLSSKGVMGWSPAKQGWAMKWSARLWGLYVGVELGKLAAQRVGGVATKDVKAAAAWKSAFVRNLAWAPLTVHWGSDKGVVSDWMVGALASVPGVIQMAELWRETA
ncbi:hypothetical protein CONLIGDRAFT_628489 [Coniochaeta ligniaria NRRL 30616]|uniref:Peroxin 11C n=1 Tax=Coniochaeta ligniaria NRRL 30616 TaxID=1408157 RepID=A0A1J7J2I0_9PEZI|nr:hypothetical protein CONLIGDRAFT_628489 [Coniochaeta ligniaria NRRL 30616]